MFHVLLLEYDITRKRQMNKFAEAPEFEPGNNKENELETIQDNAVYIEEANKHLQELYYLVIWKGYPKEKNT